MDYEKYLIKEYKYWKVYLFENQCYLGRCYVWAKREEVVDFFDMTSEEKEEYFKIGKKLKKVLTKLFKPDLYNYASLGNVSPHLHTHVVPRYKGKREFGGITFIDKRWGKNYAPYREFNLKKSILMELKETIIRELSE